MELVNDLHAASGPIVDPRLLDRCPFQPGDGHEWVVVANVGSVAHGTRDPQPDTIDDVDLMGALLPPPSRILGLHRFEHWQEYVDELDITVYGLDKIVRLWLKNNPNVLGLLWLPPCHYRYRSASFEPFWRNRKLFSSKRFYGAVRGYAAAQLHDMDKGVYRGYMGAARKQRVDLLGYDSKSAAHLIRLQRLAIEFLTTGILHVDRSHLDAEELKAIKRGEWSRDAILTEADHGFRQLDAAADASPLPEHPNEDAVERLLARVTFDHLSRSYG